MALLDRISGNQPATEKKIAVHQFQAAINLWQQGLLTRANIISGFNIASGEESDLDFLKTKYVAALNKPEYMKGLDSVFMLAEQNRFGMETQSTFVAAINALALIPA